METRAHHLAVGIFVLVLVAAIAVFAVWITKFRRQPDVLPITRSASASDVTGLSVGGPVRYRGVQVGNVSDIRIDPDNPDPRAGHHPGLAGHAGR